MNEQPQEAWEPKLSAQARALYNFLKGKTLGTDNAVEQYEVYSFLKGKGYEISWNENQNQHNDHCRKLKDLVDEINFNQTVDKFVNVTNGYKYRIANEEEARQIIAGYYSKALLALRRYNLMLAKARRNNQGKLVNNAGNQIKPQNEQFHEAFNPPEKPYQKVAYTYDETIQGGLTYSHADYMKVASGLTDEEIEAEIKSKLVTGRTLTHWRKVQ